MRLSILAARTKTARAVPAILAAHVRRNRQARWAIFGCGFTPEPVLQAEKLPDSLRQQVQIILQSHGFWPCTIEIGGSISGFL